MRLRLSQQPLQYLVVRDVVQLPIGNQHSLVQLAVCCL
jgi:hypothetical protein